jgi:hypothetical protein
VITEVVEISEVKRSDKNTALDFLALPFLAMKKGRSYYFTFQIFILFYNFENE